MHPTGQARTLADAVVTQTAIWRDLLLVVSFSLFNAMAAQLTIPLPFTPVPITAQTLAVLLTGLLLGSRLGAASILVYLLEGLGGLPVFSGGRSGASHLLGPTGGYLAGFLVAAYVVGWLAERGWDRRIWSTGLAMVIGNIVIYVCGVAWLTQFMGPTNGFAQGVLPFLSGDLIKILLAMLVVPASWRLLGNAR